MPPFVFDILICLYGFVWAISFMVLIFLSRTIIEPKPNVTVCDLIAGALLTGMWPVLMACLFLGSLRISNFNFVVFPGDD